MADWNMTKTMIYLWAVLVAYTAIMLYFFQNIWNGVLLGWSLGMLVGSIFYYGLEKIVDRYRELTAKLLILNKEIIRRTIKERLER